MSEEAAYPERRKNALLRLLINEMMQQIRELQAHEGPWPSDERDRVERDLDRIMEQVRGAAIRKEGA
jgi:hypothetical protein